MCRRCFSASLTNEDFKFRDSKKLCEEELLFRLSFASSVPTEEVEECINKVLNDPEYIHFVKNENDPEKEYLLCKQILIVATMIQFKHPLVNKDQFLISVVERFSELMSHRSFPINSNPWSWTPKDSITNWRHIAYSIILEWILAFVYDMRSKSLEEILSQPFVVHYLKTPECKQWIIDQIEFHKNKKFDSLPDLEIKSFREKLNSIV